MFSWHDIVLHSICVYISLKHVYVFVTENSQGQIFASSIVSKSLFRYVFVHNLNFESTLAVRELF